MKRCGHCKVEKPLTDFRLVNGEKIFNWCRSCSAEYDAQRTRPKLRVLVAVDEKLCSACQTTKTSSHFNRNAARADGLSIYCRDCLKRKNIEKPRKQKKIYKRTNLPRSSLAVYAGWIRRKYGLELEQYLALLRAQDFKCAICGIHESEIKGRMVVDHCHNSLRVRGLLCRACNVGIGNLKEDAERLRKAAKYLEDHESQRSQSQPKEPAKHNL